MPRGNDTEGNAQWNEQTLAAHGILGNAEDMIRAHRASIDRSAIKAMLVHEDDEASVEANDDLDAAAEKLGILPDSGDTLIAVAVHGNALVGVVENELSGLTRKVIGPWNEKYVPPKLTQQEKIEVEQAREHHAVAVEITRLREAHEVEMAQFRADAETQLAEALSEIRAAAATGPTEGTKASGGSKEDGGPAATKGAIALANEHEVDLTEVTATGEGGKITQPDVAKYLSEKQSSG